MPSWTPTLRTWHPQHRLPPLHQHLTLALALWSNPNSSSCSSVYVCAEGSCLSRLLLLSCSFILPSFCWLQAWWSCKKGIRFSSLSVRHQPEKKSDLNLICNVCTLQTSFKHTTRNTCSMCVYICMYVVCIGTLFGFVSVHAYIPNMHACIHRIRY
jgi:hypothetical protein